MGFISDLKTMADVQRIKNGGKARLSVSQITCLIVNMSDAKQFLPEEQFDAVFNLFKRLRKVKWKTRMDIYSYYDVAAKIVLRFNMIAPFELYSGDDPSDSAKLLDVLLEKYAGLDALAIETELIGLPGKANKKGVVVLSVLLFLCAAMLGYSLYLLMDCNEKNLALKDEVKEIEAEQKVDKKELDFWNDYFVIVTQTGEAYHRYDCYKINTNTCRIISKLDAYVGKYKACLICQPEPLQMGMTANRNKCADITEYINKEISDPLDRWIAKYSTTP